MLVPYRPHKLHRNHHMALPPSNEWLFQQGTQVLKAGRDEEWLFLGINGADVNDNVLCTRNMEESGFDLRDQKG